MEQTSAQLNQETKAPLVEIRGASYRYRQGEMDGVLAVNRVDLTIREGEFLAVIGRNGSGKSTLAKLLNALYVPTEGVVKVAGMDTADESHTFDIRATAGMVFQNPDNQLVASVVEEDVAFALENLGVPPKEIRARVDAALAEMRMSAFAKKEPHMLSGGQKQRVALAGVFAMRPRMIILDEPTAMLDPEGRAEVMQAIAQMNRVHGMTIVLITHFMEEALGADRLCVMSRGEITLCDTPYAVFRQKQMLEQLGLTIPFEAELAHLLEGAGAAVPHRLNMEDLGEVLCRLLQKN